MKARSAGMKIMVQTEEDETEEPGTSVDPVFDRVLEQQPPHKTPPRDAKDIRLSVEDIDETLQEEKKVFVDVLTREEQITFSVPAAALLFLAIAQLVLLLELEWQGIPQDKLLVVWFFLCVFVFAALVALLLIAYFLLLAAPSRNLRRAQYMAMGTPAALLSWATRKVPPDMEMAPDHTRQDDVMVTDGVVELTAEGLYTFAHQEEPCGAMSISEEMDMCAEEKSTIPYFQPWFN
nr:hypothetical protein BaRGS_023019 [Batillaria attramentaria]